MNSVEPSVLWLPSFYRVFLTLNATSWKKKNSTFLFINIVIMQWILQLICEIRMEDQRWPVWVWTECTATFQPVWPHGFMSLPDCHEFLSHSECPPFSWNGLFILVCYQHCYIIIIIYLSIYPYLSVRVCGTVQCLLVDDILEILDRHYWP